MASNGQFLTEKHREYLTGEHEPPTKNAERQIRSNIRGRTLDAVVELGFVTRHLSRRDLTLLFEGLSPVTHHEAALNSESVDEKKQQKKQNLEETYDTLVAIQSLLYEVHFLNDWDFAAFLRFALETAHGHPKMSGVNPRGLPHRVVDEDEYDFTPGLKTRKKPQERFKGIQEKVEAGKEPLSDEEWRFYTEFKTWETADQFEDFKEEQRRLRSDSQALDDFVRARPWMHDDDGE